VKKTQPHGTLTIETGKYPLEVRPSARDDHDEVYRPPETVLLPELDVIPKDRHVLDQAGKSASAHAVAQLAAAVLEWSFGERMRVSPEWLAYFAGNYAEGDTSIRPVLLAWRHHGVLPDSRWPLDPTGQYDEKRDVQAAELAMRRAISSFCRVDHTALADMKVAIGAKNGVVAASSVHAGWANPVRGADNRYSVAIPTIERPPGSAALGGHAFAVLGYTEVGFLIRNTWGPAWGQQGHAILPYSDWLESAFEAWVVSPASLAAH